MAYSPRFGGNFNYPTDPKTFNPNYSSMNRNRRMPVDIGRFLMKRNGEYSICAYDIIVMVRDLVTLDVS